MLGALYSGFMGGVRAENYMHHADYSSEVSERTRIPAGQLRRLSLAGRRTAALSSFSAGSGGGYAGMAEEGYLN